MVKPHLFLTLLEENGGLAQSLASECARFGLTVRAHFWEKKADCASLAPVLQEMADPSCSAWLIAGTAASFHDDGIRKGLSMAALASFGSRGMQFPIILLPASSDPLNMPSPFAKSDIVLSSIGAKVTARLHARQKPTAEENSYRFAVHALPGLGLWLEIGPSTAPWEGVFLGTAGTGAAPDAHGVGPKGCIPQKSTLHYPVKGMKIESGSRQYEAWGVQNELNPANSYFVRLQAIPDALIFGSFPKEDSAEVFSISLT
ncbi:MAG: hypothetical protein PUB69_06275 [Desulfovibrionaceae bacterium]|nr:hypothetical protein [Desulfovibrionaceae bacterium]